MIASLFCFQSFPILQTLEKILIPPISWVLKIQYFDKIIYNYIQYFEEIIYMRLYECIKFCTFLQ